MIQDFHVNYMNIKGQVYSLSRSQQLEFIFSSAVF